MLNKCCFIGNVGKDPEIRSLSSGKEVANLSLAVSERWKDAAGEKKERTEWIKISVFNEGLVGVIKNYVKKGSKLYIEGQLQTRKWTDKDGVEKYSTEIVLQNFNGTLVMLGDKKSDNSESDVDQAYTKAAKALTKPSIDPLDDEIPF